MSLRAQTIRELPAEEKIRPFAEIPSLIRSLGISGLTPVLAQGVFDIFHVGHVGYLREARRLDPENGIVVVAIENDESVRLNKGDNRPVNSATERAQVLAELMSTGLVTVYEDTPRYDRPQDYIERYQAIGATAVVVPTWDPHRDLKQWQANEAGAQLALVDYQHENSTTRMLRAVGYEG